MKINRFLSRTLAGGAVAASALTVAILGAPAPAQATTFWTVVYSNCPAGNTLILHFTTNGSGVKVGYDEYNAIDAGYSPGYWTLPKGKSERGGFSQQLYWQKWSDNSPYSITSWSKTCTRGV